MVAVARTSSTNLQSRRQSSGPNSHSSSSVSTVKTNDRYRSPSATRRPLEAASLSYEATTARSPSMNRTSSPSKPRSSSNTRLPLDSNSHDNYGHQSQSSNSTTSTSSVLGHRRNSSFTKRFSFGMSSLNAVQSGRRSISPRKAPRSSDSTSSPQRRKDSTAAQTQPNSDTQPYTSSTRNDARVLNRPTPITPSANSFARGGATETEIKMAKLRDRFEPLRAANSGTITKAPTVEMTERRQRSDENNNTTIYTRHNAKDSKQSASSEEQGSPAPKRSRSRLEKDKKAMLAKALQRANDAVLLDNALEYAKAIASYNEACDLLSQVMSRTLGEDDKRKLMTIRSTYTERVDELKQMDRSPNLQQQDTKQSSSGDETSPNKSSASQFKEFEPPLTIRKKASGTLLERGTVQTKTTHGEANAKSLDDSLEDAVNTSTTIGDHTVIPGLSESFSATTSGFAPPLRSSILPPPLSLRPQAAEGLPEDDQMTTPGLQETEDQSYTSTRARKITESGISWLGSMHESIASSNSSSRHSLSSINGIQRKHLRMKSNDTGAEFDAAFDAAVEAAYDDGYEPYFGPEKGDDDQLPHGNLQPRFGHDEALPRPLGPTIAPADDGYDGEPTKGASEQDSDQTSDERDTPDDTNKDSPIDDQHFDSPGQQKVPRQSGSSGFSGRTWGSSVASSLTTPGTSLPPVEERGSLPSINQQMSKAPTSAPPAPPPAVSLPPAPTSSKPPSPDSSKQSTMQHSGLNLPSSNMTVRDRRLSPQRAKKLKIETAVGHSSSSQTSEENIPPVPQLKQPLPPEVMLAPPRSDPGSSQFEAEDRIEAQTAEYPADTRQIASPYPSPFPGLFPRSVSHDAVNPSISPETPGLYSTISQENLSVRPSPQSGSPATSYSKALPDRPLRKNLSSLSLKKAALAPTVGTDLDFSPGTPMSINFATAAASMNTSKVPMNTPVVGAFPVNQSQPQPQPSARLDMALFDTDFHSPTNPGSPSALVRNPPKALEPCPESFLLRPFWLLRCIQQTLTHPKGGYLTTKLFIPREVWEVKHVKLKGIEDKIATCDLLSAALLSLSAVDTLDADAVLAEMQSFENVLDLAQTNLTKKIGSEVGVQSASTLFKEAPSEGVAVSSTDGTQRTSNGDGSNERSSGNKSSSKTYLSSWRKLRSKNSNANLAGFSSSAKDSQKDNLTMKSLPMTSSTTQSSRHKKDGPVSKPDGPNADYMGALAKLCDAAQVLDQIARQVEDPGLRHSSPTHVGLELCARHASEFFGFYICRFIIQDITILAEKHIKRATEWALT